MKSIIAALSLFFAIIPLSLAEQAQKFGDIEIHYNAILTHDLTPEIAKTYNIDRSANRGLLTISVLKKNSKGSGEPISAAISANTVNLNNQLSKIDLREIKEGKAIYYIGQFRVSPPELLKFTIDAKLPGETQKHSLEFQQQFYPPKS